MDELKHTNLPYPSAHLEEDPLLTTREAATFLGLAPSTVQAWRFRRSDGPRFLKIGKKVLYPLSELHRFKEKCFRTSTSG